MSNSVESHLDPCCLQNLLLSPVAVKELKRKIRAIGIVWQSFNMMFLRISMQYAINMAAQ